MQDTVHVVLSNGNGIGTIIDTYFPIAVLIVSIFGLILSTRHNKRTLNQMAEQHRVIAGNDLDHNKRSLRPKLHTTCAFIESKEGNSVKLSYIIFNNGLGPAYVKNVDYHFNGEKYKEIDKLISDEFEDINLDFEKKKGTIFTNITSTTIAKGGEIIAFSIIAAGTEYKNLSKLYSHLRKVNCQIDYSSIYDEKFTLDYPINPRKHIPELDT